MPTIYQPLQEHPHLQATDPGLLAAVSSGNARLTVEQGLELLTQAPLHTLGRYADARCRSIHGDHIRSYIIDRNINYTNICTAKCIFCAFKRKGDEPDAYTLEYDELYQKVQELSDIGGTQILMQGGMNPNLGLDWYLELLSGIRERFPHVKIHAFSPPELIEFVNFFDPPGNTLIEKVRWVLIKLKDAGMGSLPGGGGEIFAPAVRSKIGMGKCDMNAWLEVMYAAHSLGMFTSASMMYGHIEGYADRIHHMHMVRHWQDKAIMDFGSGQLPDSVAFDPTIKNPETGGHYLGFHSWPFQPDNTALGRLPHWPTKEDLDNNAPFPGDAVANLAGTGTKDADPNFGRCLRLAGSTEYLRTQAVSRLMLDNLYTIGSSWVTMGPHIGQVALNYGANDMGSVMMEENVVSSAGTTYCLDEAVLCRLIRNAGFTPAQRDTKYDIIKTHTSDQSPDLLVKDWSAHRTKRLHIEADEHSPCQDTQESAPISMTVGQSD
ncbi:MAG: radical SAM protein [Phycisphaerales bacterium]